MSTDDACDVLVVGAGPAGSALAAVLARVGQDVTLIEARRHPRVKTCAEYASPRIVEELARLEVDTDAWRATAQPLEGMRVITGPDAFDVRYTDQRGRRPAWGLDRPSFDALLATHAIRSGARLAEHTHFERALFDGGGGRRVVGAVVRDGIGTREIRSRWVIGADGARSRVARSLGVARPPRFVRRLGLIARYEAAPELDGHGEMHVGDGWYVGLAPVPNGELNVGMALPMAATHGGGNGTTRAAAWTAEARFEAAIAGLPAVAARLKGRRRLTRIRGAAPIGHRVTAPAGNGWLLIGDAAGFIDPFTGEGIYRALRSARAAAEALAGGDRNGDTVAAYLRRRRAAFAGKDALTWLIQGMLAAPPVLAYAVRRLAQRPAVGATLGSALGDCRPASDALSPVALTHLLRP